MKLTKYHYHRRFVIDDKIYTLAYFHKGSVTCRKEIQKDCNN